MAVNLNALLEQVANKYGVPVRIAQNLAMAESSMNPNAKSPAGAIGIMQLLPSTAKSLGVDPYDPAQNIEGGIRYLKQQYDRFGSWPLAVAAYNAGPGAVQKFGGIPSYPETQQHVAKVTGTTQPIQSLYNATKSVHTSDWREALRNALQFINAYRDRNLWDQIPAGTKTLAKLQQEEEARHNKALEDIARGELGVKEQSLDIDRVKALAALQPSGPETAGERTYDAETKAYNKLVESYRELVADQDWYNYPFVAAAETMRKYVYDPDFRSGISKTGGNLRSVLDMFTQTALGIPLKQFAQDIRKSTGFFDAEDNVVQEDPLSTLVNALVQAEENVL